MRHTKIKNCLILSTPWVRVEMKFILQLQIYFMFSYRLFFALKPSLLVQENKTK